MRGKYPQVSMTASHAQPDSFSISCSRSPENRFNVRKQIRVRFAAIEECDVVSACESGVDEMPSNKTRTADDEDVHGFLFSLIPSPSPAGRRESCPLSHRERVRVRATSHFFTLVNIASVALASSPSGRML